MPIGTLHKNLIRCASLNGGHMDSPKIELPEVCEMAEAAIRDAKRSLEQGTNLLASLNIDRAAIERDLGAADRDKHKAALEELIAKDREEIEIQVAQRSVGLGRTAPGQQVASGASRRAKRFI
jgi:hypothetical protein